MTGSSVDDAFSVVCNAKRGQEMHNSDKLLYVNATTGIKMHPICKKICLHVRKAFLRPFVVILRMKCREIASLNGTVGETDEPLTVLMQRKSHHLATHHVQITTTNDHQSRAIIMHPRKTSDPKDHTTTNIIPTTLHKAREVLEDRK